MENSKWQKSQICYWNDIADKYDSIYKNQWSKLENLDVQNRLESLLYQDKTNILDLGCGTGLGYEIFQSIFLRGFSYTGIDISEAMLCVAKKKFQVLLLNKVI